MTKLLETFRRSNQDALFSQEQPTALQFRRQMTAISVSRNQDLLVPIPKDVSIIVGEVFYNLRAALDYLVYELARQDSGIRQDATQFIIEDVRSDPKEKSRGFEPRSKRSLRGLNPRHIDQIESFQPYKGVAWTKMLRDISNPDKHRELVVVRGSGSSTTVIRGSEGMMKSYSEKVLPGVGENGSNVYIDPRYEVDITFPDGRLLLETLQILKRKVAETIDAFKPEFN
ncbi:MAG: hypothetical protein ABSF14_08640 [Terriglobia bacterium]